MARGIAAHNFVRFINKLLEIMGEDADFKGSYLTMNNASIHKSQSLKRKIESKGSRVVFLPTYSPELNLIEQL